MSVTTHRTTWCHSPDHKLNTVRRENLKSHYSISGCSKIFWTLDHEAFQRRGLLYQCVALG
jgi:hypothetical protein